MPNHLNLNTGPTTDNLVWLRDQTGRRLAVPREPQRIVSLVPSQTELLFDLGLAERVCGVTRYCLHPENARTIATSVGGTKRLNTEVLDALEPDLIIGNKEENERSVIEALQERYPVWLSDIEAFDQSLAMIRQIGELTGMLTRADALATDIRDAWTQVPQADGQRVLYMIWQKPFMAVGEKTYIHDVIERLGFTNCMAGTTRYPELDSKELADLEPDYVFLSSEPYPFEIQHVTDFQRRFPRAQVQRVDGEMFSWYGSRQLPAVDYFDKMISETCGHG